MTNKAVAIATSVGLSAEYKYIDHKIPFDFHEQIMCYFDIFVAIFCSFNLKFM